MSVYEYNVTWIKPPSGRRDFVLCTLFNPQGFVQMPPSVEIMIEDPVGDSFFYSATSSDCIIHGANDNYLTAFCSLVPSSTQFMRVPGSSVGGTNNNFSVTIDEVPVGIIRNLSPVKPLPIDPCAHLLLSSD